MKRALLMAMSGALIGLISFSAAAMNAEELEADIAISAEISKSRAHDIHKAFNDVIRERTGRGERVTIDGFGSYAQGVAYQTQVRNPSTGQLMPVTKYKYPKNQPEAGHMDVIRDMCAKLDGSLSCAAVARGFYAHINALKVVGIKGGLMEDRGFGTYYVRNVGEHTRTLPDGRTVVVKAHKEMRFKRSKEDQARLKWRSTDANPVR